MKKRLSKFDLIFEFELFIALENRTNYFFFRIKEIKRSKFGKSTFLVNLLCRLSVLFLRVIRLSLPSSLLYLVISCHSFPFSLSLHFMCSLTFFFSPLY